MQKFQFYILNILLFWLVAIPVQIAQKDDQISIIPKPNKMESGVGHFQLNQETSLYIENQLPNLSSIQNRFHKELTHLTGFQINPILSDRKKNTIRVQRSNQYEKEAYALQITPSKITIKCSTSAGAYYALQSLKQLIPLKSSKIQSKKVNFKIPCVSIEDEPAFEWRGFMLDVSRHFFDKEEVKKVINYMAALKLNQFHWHLADDQGWRVEIKKYPKLTSIGAWRVDYINYDESVSNWWGRPVQKDGEKATYGGFYTQEEIKEIIAYAKERYIEILPEIDVPGHSQEILAAHPELACEDRDYKVATGGAYKDNALCPSQAETFHFLEEVLGEVMDLFPFDYIHIGGDECNKDGWKKHDQCQELIKSNGLKDVAGLQSYFIKRVEKIVNQKGKNMIGWDEILEGGLAPNATVMSWRGEKGGIEAAKQKHNVIMTPSYANYLDLKQGQSDFEPNLGYSEALLSTCYNYSVIPQGLTKEEAKYILGTQGNLWTESISDWNKLTYMTFPRIFAVAENAWTSESNQNFGDFISRLHPQLEKLKSNNVRYANSVFNVWTQHEGNGKSIEVNLSSELPDAEIRYTLDGSIPNDHSQRYSQPFSIFETTMIKSGIFENGNLLGNISEIEYPIHLASGAKVIDHSTSQKEKPTSNVSKLTDLSYGQLLAKGDTSWLSLEDDLDVEIILNENQNIQAVHITSLKATISAVYPPRKIEIFGSTDGQTFQIIGDSGFIKTSHIQGRNKIKTSIDSPAENIKSIRVKVYKLDPIPDGHHKAGQKSILRIDEIVVE